MYRCSNISRHSTPLLRPNHQLFDQPDKLAAAVSTNEIQELLDVLESLRLVVDDCLREALLVLNKELINAQLQSKLSRDVDRKKIAKRQREYYLMEQLKGVKKELGMESDGKDRLIERIKESLVFEDASSRAWNQLRVRLM